MMQLIWCIALLLALPAQSEKFHLKVTKTPRKVINLGAFGFAGGANSGFNMKVENFVYYDENGIEQKQSFAPVGFTLEDVDTISTARLEQYVHYDAGTCFADLKRPERISVVLPSTNWTILETKQDFILRSRSSPVAGQGQVIEVTNLKPGFLALFFFNCNHGSRVSFSVKVEEYNMFDGQTKSWLSLGKTHLPTLYFAFCFAHAMAFGAWSMVLSKNMQRVQKIHYLMAILLLLKASSLFFEGIQYHVISLHGNHSILADVPFYFFLSMKGVCLFVVILLIGTGWSFLKPCLGEKDKRILMIVVPLQVMVNIAIVIVDTWNEGNSAWSVWRDILRIFDIICCCAILLPIVWSIRNFREGGDERMVKNLVRLRQFRTFYILVVAYIYFTRIVVVLIRSALHYQYTWVAPFIFELGTFVFYIWSGYKFSPVPENELIKVDSDDEELDPVPTKLVDP